MEIRNKLTVTRGEGQGDNGAKKGKGHQETWIKDPWTKTMGGLNVGVGRAGESNGGNEDNCNCTTIKYF